MTPSDRSIAMVTGAARGIGATVAARLATTGMTVVVADIDRAGAERTAEGIRARGGAATSVQLDVTDRTAVGKALDQIDDTVGMASVLVTCAGIIAPGEPHGVLDMPPAEWEAVIAVNLSGTMYCAQAVSQRLAKAGRGGAMVLISSLGATRPTAGSPAYHASKGGVEALTRALAVGLAPYGIRVNAVAPGFVDSEMTREARNDSALRAMLEARVPEGRLGRPEEIASVVAFLVGSEATYITGQVVLVDGGSSILGWRKA